MVFHGTASISVKTQGSSGPSNAQSNRRAQTASPNKLGGSKNFLEAAGVWGPSRRERFSPIASPSAAHCNDGLKGRERRCHALSRFRSFYLRCEAMAAPSPLAGNYLPAYYVACDLAEWEIEI